MSPAKRSTACFVQNAEQDEQIRRNPVARASDLLQKVFGGVGQYFLLRSCPPPMIVTGIPLGSETEDSKRTKESRGMDDHGIPEECSMQ